MSEPQQQTEKGTTYVVLEGSEQEAYRVVGRYAATSSAAAIRKHVGAKRDGGTYVAVTARSWKPVRVTVETKQTVKLG